jgi:phosphonate transport system substrate-binding protein
MDKARRIWLKRAATALSAVASGVAVGAPGPAIRIGLTPVILDSQTRFLDRWRRWLESQLGARVEFVQRPRYRDITDLLLDRRLTAAWICGYPYVRHRAQLRLAAVPVYQGRPRYRSLLISGTAGQPPASLEQMAGRVFAFSDPDSNSGYLYPMYRLREVLRARPAFFRRTFFTWGHSNTIEAVASGLADGGAVDSYVWEALASQHPGYRDRIDVIERSPEFGFPPLVTHRDLPDDVHAHLAGTLLRMHTDPAGRELLGALYLDRFGVGDAADYDSIAAMIEAVGELEEAVGA